jgi:hypothetical protein
MTTPDRPRPVASAANWAQKTLGMIGAMATAAAGYGILAAAQNDAIQGLLGAIPGVIALVSNFLVAFGVTQKAEPEVTPISDPRDNAGNMLTPDRVTP